MFDFFKNKSKQVPTEEPKQEFLRLEREMDEQSAFGETPREKLIYAMGVIQRELNEHDGANWEEESYGEFLDALREILGNEPAFSPEQLERIRGSLDEILACGRELESVGESGRNATEAVDYLVARVVDWCHFHPLNESPK